MVQDDLASNAKIMYTGMRARSEIRWDGTHGMCHLFLCYLPWLGENAREEELRWVLLDYVGRDGMGRLLYPLLSSTATTYSPFYGQGKLYNILAIPC